ncbi:MAG TPA: hypothetical protein V6D18_05140, partial [Thermosynechococcaceae cyanobacterium]
MNATVLSEIDDRSLAVPQIAAQPDPVSTFRFAVNRHGCNKDWDFRILSSHFQDVEGTLDTVIAHLQQGHAICAGLLGGQWRRKSNFAGSQWVLIDIDNSAVQCDDQGKTVKAADGKALKV